MATYEIIIALPGEFYGARGGEWSNELGAENEFPTMDAATAAISELRAMGGEWATGIYAVREVGTLYPEFGTIDEPEA